MADVLQTPGYDDGSATVSGIVVISSYNSASQLPTALDALCRQTGDVLYEVILVDNNAVLIVVWDGVPIDVVDHPTAGRLGPVPYKRSGSHVHRGFLMAAGPGISAGARLPEAHALDIPPTVLTLLGTDIPAHFDGKAVPVLEDPVGVRMAG